MQDDRIIRENGLEARVAGIVMPVLDALGYRLVRVKLSAQDGLTVQIMAERMDGTMTVDDCEEVSRAISPVMDVEDPIEGAYQLEISSPGIDRPLVRQADFEAAVGHVARIETSVLIDGRKRFRGKIAACTPQALSVERTEESGEGDNPLAEVPLDTIAEAKLVLTDELIREALKKDKEERRQRKKARRRASPADDAVDAE